MMAACYTESMKLTEREISALRFYEGDVSGDDPFLSDPKAYLTLNALLYPGIRNEEARTAEGKKLNPAITEDTERLLDLYRHLFSALVKGTADTPRRTYRVERWSDFLAQQDAGITLSFTSTSTAGFLPAYRDRIGIALLKFTIPAGIPALGFSEALPHYAKSEEHEILLPPFLHVSFREIPVTPQEMTILDAENRPPVTAAEADVSLPERKARAASRVLPVCPEAGNVYRALNAGKTPDPADIQAYLEYKEILREMLEDMFLEELYGSY